MLEISTKYAGIEQQFRSQIFNLQVENNELSQDKKNLQRELETLNKKYDHIKEAYDKNKGDNHENEKKLLTLNRLENKNKELDEFNKKLQGNLQKLETELKEKHKQFLEFSYSRNVKDKNLSESFDAGISDRKRKSWNIQKKVDLRNSIRETESVIKEHKEKMDDVLKLEPNEAERH